MDVKVVNNGETVVLASDAFQADSPSHAMSIQLPFRCETNFVEQKRLSLKKSRSIFQMLKLVLEGVNRTDISLCRKRQNSEEIYDTDINLVSE